MKKYRYREHGVGYQIGKTLRHWRPQYPIILSWINGGTKVLDVGCGDGVLGEKLFKEKKCAVWGIDLDTEALAEAKRKGVKARVWDSDEHLPFADHTFDLAIACELIQFVKNPDFVVSETLRVSKTAIIAFPNFGFWFYRLEHLLGKFPKLSLYGHTWWETSQTKFFSLSDFLDLPSVKTARITKIVCIDWKNREVSMLAKLNPNLFGRSCILMLEKKMNIPKRRFIQ